MRKNLRLVTGLICISASAFAIAVYSQQSSIDSEAAADQVTTAGPPIALFVDRQTWNVHDPSDPDRDLSEANTLDRRTARWKSVLAIGFPDEHARRFPLAQEEEAVARESAYAIENPQPLDEFLRKPRAPEEQEALERIFDSILNPTISAD